MKFDAAFISRLEKLSRLRLDDAERELLAADLTKIVAMVDKLNTFDTAEVEPLVWLSEEGENIVREDIITGQISREAALQNAPEHDEQFFRVKKFVNQG